MSELVLFRDGIGTVRPFPRITNVEGVTVVEMGDGAPVVLTEGESLFRRMTSQYNETVINKPENPSKSLEVGKRVIADNRDVLDRLKAAYCGECGMHPAHLPEPCTQVDLVAHIPPETGRIECKCGHPAKTSDRRSASSNDSDSMASE